MSDIRINDQSGLTLYALIERKSDGYIYNVVEDEFAAPAAEHWPACAIELVESPAASGMYAAAIPAGVDAGEYLVMACQQAAATAAVGDEIIGSADLYWDGEEEITPRELAIAIDALSVLAGEHVARLAGPDYTSSGGSIINLSVARGETPTLGFVAVDGNRVALDLSGRHVQFVVTLDGETTTLGNAVGETGVELPTTPAGVTGAVAVAIPSALTAKAGSGDYELWDATNGLLIARGQFIVKAAVGPQ